MNRLLLATTLCALSLCSASSAQLLNRLADLVPGSASSDPVDFLELGGRTLFLTSETNGPARLWTTDGTTNGTRAIADLGMDRRGRMQLAGSRALIVVSSFLHAPELWVTDGSAAGTTRIGVVSSEVGGVQQARAVGGQMFFAMRIQGSQQVLFTTDGTLAGTRELGRFRDIEPLQGFDDEVVFRGETAANGRELWISDGTASGTQILGESRPGTGSSLADDPVAYRGAIYFTPLDANARADAVWISDGTTAGTREWVRFVTITGGITVLGGAGDHVYVRVNQGLSYYEYFAVERTTAAVTFLGVDDFLRSGVEYRGSLYLRAGAFDQDDVFRADAATASLDVVLDTGSHRRDDSWLVTGSRRSYLTVGGRPYLFGSDVPLTELNRDVFLVYGLAICGRYFFCAGRTSNDLWEPYLAPVGAYARPYGSGVGHGLRVPQLRGEDPLPGATVSMNLRDAPADAPLGLVVGFHDPLAVSLDRDATIYVDPNRSTAISGRSDAAGDWSTSLQVPNDSSLLGARLTLQTLVSGGTSSPRGFELSNGLVLRIGR